MKKFLSFMLASVMLVSAVPAAFAADTQDYSQGTQVVFEAANNESYTITVPAKLNPGQAGTVTLDGMWPSNKTISVTADPTVTLTNNILASDQKVLDVVFLGIAEAGNDTTAQTFTESVSVEGIENALFGTWSGKFNYNVDVSDGKESQTAFKYGERYFLTSIGENYESIADYLPSEIIGYTDGTTSFVMNGVQEDLPVGALIIDGNEIRFADSDDETEKIIISADGTTLTMYNLNQEVAIWTVESAIESPLPISWNTLDVTNNTEVIFNNWPLVKVSSATPSLASMENAAVYINTGDKILTFPYSFSETQDGFSLVAYQVEDISFNTVAVFIATQAGEYNGIVFEEPGIYVGDMYGEYGWNYDCEIK